MNTVKDILFLLEEHMVLIREEHDFYENHINVNIKAIINKKFDISILTEFLSKNNARLISYSTSYQNPFYLEYEFCIFINNISLCVSNFEEPELMFQPETI